MEKTIGQRRLRRMIPIILIGIIIILILFTAFVAYHKNDRYSRVSSRVYGVDLSSEDQMLFADIDKKGNLVAIGRCSVNFNQQIPTPSDLLFMYDWRGKMTRVETPHHGILTVTEYDRQGRAIKAEGGQSHANDDDVVNELNVIMTVTYHNDGASTWDFKGYYSDSDRVPKEIYCYKFDKHWRVIGGSYYGKTAEISAKDNIVTYKNEGQELVATYNDENRLVNVAVGKSSIDYEFNDKGFCTSATLNDNDIDRKIKYCYKYDKSSNLIRCDMYNGDECSWTTSCKYDYLNRLTQIKTLNYLEGKEHSETLSKTRYYGWSNTPRYASEKNVQNGVVRSEWVTKCYKSGAISEVMYKSYNENGKMSYYHFSSMNEDMSPIDRETVNYHDNGCVKHHEVELYRDGILRLREETYYTQSGKISEYYKTVYDKNGKIEFETVEIYEQTTTNTESMPEPIETESDTEVEESLLVESESVITE